MCQKKPKATCSVEGCGQTTIARGLCQYHYYRARLQGQVGNKRCDVSGCGRPHVAKGLCARHYDTLRRNGDPLVKRTRTSGTCKIDGCEQPQLAKGMCGRHYSAMKRNGDVRDHRKSRGICKVNGCGRPHCASGLCNTHYWRMRKGLSLDQPIRPNRIREICIVVGCQRQHSAKGLCSGHYQQWRNGGIKSLQIGQKRVLRTVRCEECGRVFVRHRSEQRKQRSGTYCSRSCAAKANNGNRYGTRRTPPSPCTLCGKLMMSRRPSSIRQHGAYCSVRCYRQDARRLNQVLIATRPIQSVTCKCEKCGKVIVRKPSQLKKNALAFCSCSCKAQFYGAITRRNRSGKFTSSRNARHRRAAR